MKKIVSVFIALLLLTVFSPLKAYAEDQSLTKVLDSKKLVVAVSGTLYPIAYYNEDNELVGYTVDILKEVADSMEIELEFKEMGVDGMLTSLESGQVDIVAEGFDITPERQEKFLFSEPIIYSLGTATVRSEDNSGIEKLEDFTGKKAAGGATTIYMQIAEKLGAIPVVYDNATNEQYFIDLTSNRTDFIPNDYYTIKSAITFYGEQYPITMANVFFNPSQAAFIYNKESGALVERIDQEIQVLRDNGKLKELAEIYYNGDNPSEPLEEINGIKLEEIPVIELD